ncbi:MAG: hypothetical protein ABIU05_21300 [Nitrospirales bacterium]
MRHIVPLHPAPIGLESAGGDCFVVVVVAGLAERDSYALLSEGPIKEEDWSFRRL